MVSKVSTSGRSAAPYVFLSYASANRQRALAISAALQAAGVTVWLDQEAIAGGTSWGSEIVDALTGCAALVICCSEAAMASRNVKQEIQLAWRFERPYLPLLLERAEFPQQVLYFLEGWQWVEVLDQPEPVWLPVLLKALARLGVASELVATSGTGLSAAAPTDPPVSAHAPETAGAASTLVGRQVELTALRERLTAAESGRGQLVMLAGEPGIGKTRLAGQLAEEASAHGDLVLWGQCWEGEPGEPEQSGAPAYLPWLQMLGSYARTLEPFALLAWLGAAAPDLAALVPEIGALLSATPPPPAIEPDAARYQLFTSMTAVLRGLCARQPLVLVLDDLHWADKLPCFCCSTCCVNSPCCRSSCSAPTAIRTWTGASRWQRR